MSLSSPLHIHGSCAAHDGAAVLMVGQPGSGKSDLVLRLIDRGFTLVADDRVMVEGGIAQAPEPLRGLLEVRGLGLVRLPYVVDARIRLVVSLRPHCEMPRLPYPQRDTTFGLPLIDVDPWHVSAANIVSLALQCAIGAVAQMSGAFVA